MPRKATGRRGSGREKPPRKDRATRADRISEVARSARSLGAANLKPGATINVAKLRTNRVTIGKRGLKSKSVDKVLSRIARQKPSPAYSYTIRVNYRQRDGSRNTKTYKGEGVPLPKSVAKRRRPGESQTAALKRLVRENIQRRIHNTLTAEWGKLHDSPQLKPRPGQTWSKMTAAQARAKLKRLKAREKVNFSVSFVQHVPAAPRARRR
jgi:hypothetical protein